MRVCDASTSISAEFGGIRDSCLDIYHLIAQFILLLCILGDKMNLTVRLGK